MAPAQDGLVLCRQLCQIEVHAKPGAHRHAAGEVHRTVAPMRDVAGYGHRRKEIGIIPLHQHPDNRVGIVAGPEFMKVFQRTVIHASAAAGTEHQFRVGESLGRLVHERVKGVNIINPKIRLAVRCEIRRNLAA